MSMDNHKISLKQLESLQRQVIAEEQLEGLSDLFDGWGHFLEQASEILDDEVTRVGEDSIAWLQSVRALLANGRVEQARQLIQSDGARLLTRWCSTGLGSVETEVWAISRHRYLVDYLSEFWSRGFDVRWISRESAESYLNAGFRPVAILDSNIYADTLDIAEASGVPFVGLPLDQWARSSRHDEAEEKPNEMLRKLNLPVIFTGLASNFPSDGSSSRRVNSFLFPVGPEQVELLEAREVPHVEQMHFGVDTGRFHPRELSADDRTRFGARVMFVGDALFDGSTNGFHVLKSRLWAAIERGDAAEKDHWIRHWRLLEELMRRQEPSFGRYVLPDLVPELEREYGVDFLEPGATGFKETWSNSLGYEISRRQRHSMAKRLTPLGLAIYGDSDWQRVRTNIPDLDYRGEADWATDLPKIINAAPIHVNVSKIMFPTGVGPRIFETLACGSLLISNRIPAIEDLFEEDREIVFYDTLDELEQKVVYYQNNDVEREAIAARGCDRVRAEHSMKNRVDRILEVTGLGQAARSLEPHTALA